MPEWSAVTISALIGAAVLIAVIVIVLLINARPQQPHSYDPSKKMITKPKSSKKQITSKSQSQQKSNSNIKFTLIKMKGCGGCNALMPTIRQLQTQYNVDVHLVEGPSMGMQWLRQNKIEYYPTMCFMDITSNKVVRKYSGNSRSIESILQFANSM